MKSQPLLILVPLVLNSLASAATLSPISYDMNNGYGVASGGGRNYWDKNYTGNGSTTTDGASLNGGLGDLTDGVITTFNFDQVENVDGTGPYVGWWSLLQPNLEIEFNFSGIVNVDSIRIHADDSNSGGVNLPASAMFTWANGGSATFPIADPDPGSTGPSWLEFSGLSANGVSSLTVKLEYTDRWIMVDEIEFNGVPVPEPSNCALLALALVGMIAFKRLDI